MDLWHPERLCYISMIMKPSDALAEHRGELRELVTRHGLAHARIFGGNALGVRTETGTPSKVSASRLNAASVKRLVFSAGSTSKSRSLCSSSVPVRTDPKMRGCDKP